MRRQEDECSLHSEHTGKEKDRTEKKERNEKEE
jgi:hypothetical protein